jgi:hypothetical protein
MCSAGQPHLEGFKTRRELNIIWLVSVSATGAVGVPGATDAREYPAFIPLLRSFASDIVVT